MMKKTLSIIIPSYNEEKTILQVLERVSRINLKVDKEIIIINDGSTDGTKEIVEKYLRQKNKPRNVMFKLINKKNGGKGSAVKRGIQEASGEIITIQDADLEYNPEDYKKIIAPIIKNETAVVYGSRFLNKHKPLYRIYFLGNKFLTFLTSVLYHYKITDMETCYKAFRKEVITKLNIRADKFDIEPEITAKLLKAGIKIKEIPIEYAPRSVEEGKKINWKDGLQAIWTLIYWRFKD